IVDEAGNDTGELRRRRNGPGGVDHDDKVRSCRNGKGVGGRPNGCSQTRDSTIAEIVQAQVCWIVATEICRTFNVPSASGGNIDRDSETRSSSAIICEVVRLEALGPWETTAGTSLSTACARVTSTAEPISLGRIIPVEYVWPKCLVRS